MANAKNSAVNRQMIVSKALLDLECDFSSSVFSAIVLSPYSTKAISPNRTDATICNKSEK